MLLKTLQKETLTILDAGVDDELLVSLSVSDIDRYRNLEDVFRLNEIINTKSWWCSDIARIYKN